MAERRMFAKTIIDSDAFLDMPFSAQALYFHLSMRADDDGFVNSPKAIIRQLGAKEDDLRILLAKRYILGFESGVIVIKHWKIHNIIQKDRYKETTYLEEKALLELDDKKAYTELEKDLETKCIQTVSKMDTQVSIGKISIDKVSKGEGNIEAVAEAFNELCPSFPPVKNLSETRKTEIRARLSTYSLDDLRRCFEKVEQSSFLKGKNNRDWAASFDWIIKDENVAKILDGNFDDRKSDADEMFEAALKRSYEYLNEDDEETI